MTPPNADDISFQLATKYSPPGSLAARIGSKLRALWYGIADELARVYGRVADLLREAHPATATELLPDWEDEYGLPDLCVTTPQTIDDRRAAVLGRLRGVGGQSRQYYYDLAASMGIPITIRENRAFLCGRDGMGDAIGGGGDTAFLWEVVASSSTTTAQRELLECTFDRLRPGHTTVTFSYI